MVDPIYPCPYCREEHTTVKPGNTYRDYLVEFYRPGGVVCWKNNIRWKGQVGGTTL